ncbi:MAG: hypothetical protein NVSMB38_20110 [Ktedonobacteraceae bacterium]
MLTIFWIFGGLLIVLAIAFLIFAVVGMVRVGNTRTQTDDGLAHSALPSDLTRNTREKESKRGENMPHQTPPGNA